jgi:hypothetical protein
MDLSGAGHDTLNNGASSCSLDSLMRIANILATFYHTLLPTPSLLLTLSLLQAVEFKLIYLYSLITINFIIDLFPSCKI